MSADQVVFIFTLWTIGDVVAEVDRCQTFRIVRTTERRRLIWIRTDGSLTLVFVFVEETIAISIAALVKGNAFFRQRTIKKVSEE